MTEPIMRMRRESSGDPQDIRELLLRAFGGEVEAVLVDRLRASGGLVLSLVAETQASVVGHLAFSPVSIENAPPGLRCLGLAPVAVAPAWQRQGIGTRLVRHGLKICGELEYHAAVVLGDPAFYARFGFRPASEFGLRCVYPAPPEAFRVIELKRGSLQGASGTVLYGPEFSGL
jgi:putative acetyltransferase